MSNSPKYISVKQFDGNCDEQETVRTRSNHSFPSCRRLAFGGVLFLMATTIVHMGIHRRYEAELAADPSCSRCRVNKLQGERNVFYDTSIFTREQRHSALDQKGATLWFTGLSGSGKSTVGKIVEQRLISMKKHVYRLDGDNIRMGLNRDLGFSPEDREENVRRLGEVAALFADSGAITLVAAVSPYRDHRDSVREMHKRLGIPFYEVFVNVSLDILKQRDTKGLYKKAMNGDIKEFTGVSAPYQAPLTPEIHLQSDSMNLEEEVNLVLIFLQSKGILTGEKVIPEGYPGVSLPDGEIISVDTKLETEVIEKIPKILIRDVDVHWVQILGEGWASPLRGFMREGTYLQSLHFCSVLSNGSDLMIPTNMSNYDSSIQTEKRINMPLPIVLPINEASKKIVGDSKVITLVGPSGKDVAILRNPEIYSHRKEERIARTFGSWDLKHPYVQMIQNSGDYLIGGEIELIQPFAYDDGLDSYRLTPDELRRKFYSMKADAVLAFQTRNPSHAGHVYLMKTAREELLRRGYKNPILWLSPLGGWTKDDDIPVDVRLRQHEAIIAAGMLDPNTTVLSLWPSPMVYAGPREVQWHAKGRRNAGANFFIVGRDPAGIKKSDNLVDMYSGDDGRYVLHTTPGLGDMNLMSFGKVYYDKRDHTMKPLDKNRQNDFLSISGSRMREMALNGRNACQGAIPDQWESTLECVPQGFMAESGWKVIVDYYQNRNSSKFIQYATQLVSPKLDSSQTFSSSGTYGKSDYVLTFTNSSQPISPWHDIPLKNADNSYNFVVEIPKGVMAKMEVNKEIPYNGIKQDIIKNKKTPRYYMYGIPFFNYGLFPQTWEDPSVVDTQGNGGDNDPLDVIEVGSRTLLMGSVNPVKVLGSLELVDQGESDHKIIVLHVDDPDASRINNIDDLIRIKPNLLDRLVDWLKNYKTQEGKPVNHLTRENPTNVTEAVAIIEATHLRWQALVNQSLNSTGFWLP